MCLFKTGDRKVDALNEDEESNSNEHSKVFYPH